MHDARKFAKGRKPVKRIWSQRRRSVLIRRNDVSPEAWDAVPVWRKYPKRLLDELNNGPCMTLSLRAAERTWIFVCPHAPSLEPRHRGYPLTNFQRKRLQNSSSIGWFRQKLEQSKRISPTETLLMWLPQSETL